MQFFEGAFFEFQYDIALDALIMREFFRSSLGSNFTPGNLKAIAFCRARPELAS